MKAFDLVFFRHGTAADTAPDCDRALTEEGIRKTRASAEGLKKLELPLGKILTSPWLRASQTAAILAEVLMVHAPEELQELAGDGTVHALLDAIGRRHGHGILLVGHQPLLGDTVAELLGAAGKCEVDLRKSGACAIQVDALPPRKPAVLKWLMTAKQLRAL